MEFGKVVKCSNKLYTGNETCDFDFGSTLLGLSSLVTSINGPLGIEANEDLKFDKKGNIYREVQFNNKGIQWFYDYNYDKKNRIVKIISSVEVERIDKDETIWYRNPTIDSIVYKGNESYLHHQNENTPKPYLWVYSKYDDNDNVIEEIRYWPSKKIGNRTVNLYDYKGRRVSSICYDSNSIINEEITQYENNVIITNNKGFQTTKTFVDDNLINKIGEIDSFGKQTWQYDNKGNVLNWQSLHGYYLYEYDYDKKGNWIKRVKYDARNNIPKEITEREIEYYARIDYLYLKVAFTFLGEFSGLLFISGLLIISLVFLFFLLLLPFKIRIDKNDNTTKYVTYVIASIVWVITGATLGSAFFLILEVINDWSCMILFILYFSIFILFAFTMRDELKDKLDFYNLVNKIIVKEYSGEITKISLVNYYSLKCVFFAFISFVSYLIYVHYSGNNAMNYKGIYFTVANLTN